MEWREEPISAVHDRAGFDCGSEELNEYLARYARQNHASGIAKTWVAVDPERPTQVLGYYSLAVAAIEFTSMPEELRRRLPRYPLPVYRLARLAVDRSAQGQGLGGELLLTAALRAQAAAASVGGIGILIDAKDEAAARWYARFGAVRLLDHELTLVLTFDAVDAAMKEATER